MCATVGLGHQTLLKFDGCGLFLDDFQQCCVSGNIQARGWNIEL